MVISVRAIDFTRVFGIPGHVLVGRKNNKKPKKLDQRDKEQL